MHKVGLDKSNAEFKRGGGQGLLFWNGKLGLKFSQEGGEITFFCFLFYRVIWRIDTERELIC